MTFSLTTVCRQPLIRPPGGCDHECDCDDCGHDCYNDCGTGLNYAAAKGGVARQCATRFTFEGATLSDAVDQAVRAGWLVDLGNLGEFVRADVCPGCNETGRGARNIFVTRTLSEVYLDPDSYRDDSWAAA